ncbi:hypothetical protein CDCA_CDCA11G3289 [Cyanidium caldarium]|uniref:Uncharacterized protein n=1 Tax=Cyanidium caldarium TaxID=2771 RepID=A0AAV9IY95_CYACA|nr:hypothetical protein CDCA_CDCA11G3289 [Cyanidium caldarium]
MFVHTVAVSGSRTMCTRSRHRPATPSCLRPRRRAVRQHWAHRAHSPLSACHLPSDSSSSDRETPGDSSNTSGNGRGDDHLSGLSDGAFAADISAYLDEAVREAMRSPEGRAFITAEAERVVESRRAAMEEQLEEVMRRSDELQEQLRQSLDRSMAEKLQRANLSLDAARDEYRETAREQLEVIRTQRDTLTRLTREQHASPAREPARERRDSLLLWAAFAATVVAVYYTLLNVAGMSADGFLWQRATGATAAAALLVGIHYGLRAREASRDPKR